MSDVTVADGGAPASSEVPVNESVHAPQPIGSQAPDKPVETPPKHGPEGRREAIQRAFERANNPPPKTAKPAEKPKPVAADAKPGHNQPPEETGKLDLKKRPDQQARGERGQFAPREPQENRSNVNEPDGTQRAAQAPRKPLPEGTPYRDPPPRMAEHAKRDWTAAPESVRGEVHRMAKETEEIYRQYRGDHEAFNPVRRFHQMATQHGTTLERALNNYVSMEQKLRADPVGGLDVIVNNLNLRTSDGQKLTFRDIAYHVLSQSPEQLKMIQQGNAQQAASHQIGALHQEIAGLKNTLQKMHTQQQFTYTRSAVDQFAETHPRFDELGELIQSELALGFDLETAYRRAELLRPASSSSTHAAQTRTPPAQTRTADKSISGAPDVAPSNGASRSQKPVGRRDAIQNAIRRVNGGI